MSDKQEFSVYHKYLKLVRRGVALPLLCLHCSEPQVVMLGKDDSPCLKCLSCNTTVHPGDAAYQNMRAQVKEFNL